MKTNTMCALALGCLAVMGTAQVQAQSATADMDKQFITAASQSDYTEIKFSELATTKASNTRVKDFAQKMITDHNMLSANMKPFADKYGVTPVMMLDSEHQAKYDSLSSMSGMNFDKEYMTAMSMDHQKANEMFKQEMSTTKDSALRKTVSSGQKVVSAHLTMANRREKASM